MEFYFAEVNVLEVKATDSAVVHGAVVYSSALEVCGCGPLCGARDVGQSLAFGKLYADGYIKVIEYMERLHHCLGGVGQRGCCGLEESGSHKAGWRSHVYREPV